MNRVLLSKQYCYHRCVTKAYCVRFYVLKKKYDFLINDFLFLPNEPKSLSLSVFNFYFQWFSCGKQQTRNEYILFQIILTKSVRTQQKKKKQNENKANEWRITPTLFWRWFSLALGSATRCWWRQISLLKPQNRLVWLEVIIIYRTN